MGNGFNKKPPPPPPPPQEPVIRVSPPFDSPPITARTMIMESSYNMLFGKQALKSLFEDYFEEARRFSTTIMLKPTDDIPHHADVAATLSAPFDLDHEPAGENVFGALFRCQSNVDDRTFTDVFVSNSDPVLQIRSCFYNPTLGIGAFSILPLIRKTASTAGDDYVIGLRHDSENLSAGVTVVPLLSTSRSSGSGFLATVKDEFPKSAWLVTKLGGMTIGAQYEHENRSTGDIKTKLEDPMNWKYAIGYGVGSRNPLSPSFNFALEFAECSQFTASFYQHVVVQRKPTNPFETVDGITNYLDFGFELQTSMDGATNTSNNDIPNPTFQLAASWQINENLLLKGKMGPLSSSVALAFKSWWKPSFTFSLSATRDGVSKDTAYGFGLRIENIREAITEPDSSSPTVTNELIQKTLGGDDDHRFEDLEKRLRDMEKILKKDRCNRCKRRNA